MFPRPPVSESTGFPLNSSSLVTYYEPGAAEGAGITVVNTTDRVPARLASILVEIGRSSVSCCRALQTNQRGTGLEDSVEVVLWGSLCYVGRPGVASLKKERLSRVLSI